MNDGDRAVTKQTGNVTGAQPVTPALNPTMYRAYVEDFDISEEQKRELLNAVFFIMKSFVELGFAVDSVSYCLPDLFEKVSSGDGDNVQSEDTSQQNTETNDGSIAVVKDGF